MSDVRLFDPDDYPSKRDVERRPARTGAGTVPADPVPEPWVDPWVVISTRKGPLPYTHLPLQPERLANQRKLGTIDRSLLITVCGQIGWPISRESSGMSKMLPCPACKAST